MSDNENVDPYNDDRWSIFKDDYLPFTNDPDIEYQELLRSIRPPIIHTSVSDSDNPTVDLPQQYINLRYLKLCKNWQIVANSVAILTKMHLYFYTSFSPLLHYIK